MKDRSEIIRAADSLWSRLVCNAAQGRCIVCGRPGSDAHHWFYKRSVHKFRWNVMNGVWLCREHHSLAVQENHELFRFIEKYLPLQWKWGQDRGPLKSEPISTQSICETHEALGRECDRWKAK